MPIQELNSQEFAKNLAHQAMQYIPEDIPEEHKKYIAKKVYEFSLITGDHLIKQHNANFTDEEAVVVIQFIGEWTFHKAIDLIRGGIRPEFWDTILQQIAFATLKAALHTHNHRMDQMKSAEYIETQVAQAYKQCIDQLVKTNVISQDKVNEILAQSNVDKMADESAKQNVSPADDEKMLKFVAIALMLKKMPQDKVNNILKKFKEDEQQKILSCLNIQDLEKKVDAEIMSAYIRDLNKNIAAAAKPSSNEMIASFKTLQANYGEEEIINLTMDERPKIQEFLSLCLLDNATKISEIQLSPYIVKILHNYLKIKLAA